MHMLVIFDIDPFRLNISPPHQYQCSEKISKLNFLRWSLYTIKFINSFDRSSGVMLCLLNYTVYNFKHGLVKYVKINIYITEGESKN